MIRPLSPNDSSALHTLFADHPPLQSVIDEKCFSGSPAGDATATGYFHREQLVGVIAHCDKWIRLLFVHGAFRLQGIGRQLLNLHPSNRTGDQPGNYLYPGVPQEQWAFWEHLGFVHHSDNQSLVANLEHFKGKSTPGVRCLAAREWTSFQAAFTGDIPPGWMWECQLALRSGGLFVNHTEDKLLGFAAHSGNNAAWKAFGPAYVRPAERGRGIGTALLHAVATDLKKSGQASMLIPWVSDTNIYERTFPTTVIPYRVYCQP